MNSNPEIKEMLPVMQDVLQQLKQYRRKEKMQKEPLAIVGMACRFPGGGELVSEFWKTLQDGRDTITEIPAERWDINAHYDPDPDAEGKTYARYGSFIQDIDLFDAPLFGISPVEAIAMDPQQRILLEQCWRAFEHAGYLPQLEPETGVFVGVSYTEYAALLRQFPADKRTLPYYSTGNVLNAIPGRLSYTFGFRGPCMAIDTACSSSLVALHLACTSLRNGECRQAVIAGVNLQLLPDSTIAISQSRMLSVDGRCKTFDAAANGYVRGEGCGVLIVKRLSDAIENGDRICAVIRGSAVNQDGGGSGFTVPNSKAQVNLMRQALAFAEVDPADIDYVEAHGTGTSLGDPIELSAIEAVYGSAAGRKQPLWVGSVKTNIGHLEAAAGIAGVIKMVLAVQHRSIPPHLHFVEPNPHVPWKTNHIRIPVKNEPWPDSGSPLAAVSSFGFSGTNAHIIVEAAPVPVPEINSPSDEDSYFHLFTLSARSQEALKQQVTNYAEYLNANPAISYAALCKSAQKINPLLSHRIALVSDSTSALKEQLQKLSQRSFATQTAYKGREQYCIVWMFTGQGSQYPGMYKELYDTQPIFRQSVDQYASFILDYAGFDMLELIGYREADFGYPGTKAFLEETRYQQPCLFVLQLAMARLLMDWGIQPDYVIGHSLGEYVAACVAGVMKAEDAIRLVIARGELMQQLPAGGGMLAVSTTTGVDLQKYLSGYGNEAGVAAANSDIQTVLSGPIAVLQQIATSLSKDNVPNHFLKVSHAFHSTLMNGMVEPFAKVLSSVPLRAPSIPIISNLSGKEVQGEISREEYWKQHILQPVLFSAGIKYLDELPGEKIWIELGPQLTLLTFVQQTLPHISAKNILPCARKNSNSRKSLLQVISSLFEKGIDADFKKIYQHIPSQTIEGLPGYPFQRKSFWPLNDQKSAAHSSLVPAKPALNGSVKNLPVYNIDWVPVTINSSPHASQRGSGVWILLRDDNVNTPLDELMQEKGLNYVSLIDRESSGLHQAENVFYWDHADPDAWKNIFVNLVDLYDGIQGIIDLRSTTIDGELPSTESEYAHSELVASRLMQMARQLAICNMLSGIRILLCSMQSNIKPVFRAGHDILAGQVIAAVSNILVKEFPQHNFIHINLPGNGDKEDWEAVLNCICLPQESHQLLLRDGAWFTSSIRSAGIQIPSALLKNKTCFYADAGYLVTGASGSIGLELVKWMIQQGARHLLLVSRRGFHTPEQKAKLLSFEQSGAKVYEIRADLSDKNEITRIKNFITNEMPPLKGVFHLAGIIDDDVMALQDEERFKKVLRAKAEAAWHLHEMTKNITLDYFVAFSSSSSWQGLPGQGAYAAANAFLNGLMEYRHALQLPALSICWGPWKAGMAAQMPESYWALLKSRGISPLTISKAFEILHALLLHSELPVYYAIEADEKALKALSTVDTKAPEGNCTRSGIIEELSQFRDEKEIVAYLGQYLKTTIAEITGFSPEDIREDISMLTLGLDSLMAVRLQHRVINDTGLQVNMAGILQGDSIHETAQQLSTQFKPGKNGRENPGLQESIDELSENEIDALLKSFSN